MSDEKLILDVVFEARPEEPDGECFGCEERIFLRSWRLWAKVNDSEWTPTKLLLCQSCFEEDDWI